MNTTSPIILGSSSVFRQQQLRTLGLPFATSKPDFDETPHAGENAQQTSLRLAIGKARSLAALHPNSLIIGADQVAWFNNRQLGKPMTVAKAQQMLLMLSGQQVSFYSAVCLLNTGTGRLQQHVDHTIVQLRPLNEPQINRYLTREPDAVYCAGAAKSEGLGSALIERITSHDPNALIGLPIFKLVEFLAEEGVSVL